MLNTVMLNNGTRSVSGSIEKFIVPRTISYFGLRARIESV